MITVIRYGKLATFILFFITLIYSISHLFIENTNIFLRNIISILPIVNTFIYLLISIPISRLSNKYLRNFSIGEALVVLCMMLIYLEKPYFLYKNIFEELSRVRKRWIDLFWNSRVTKMSDKNSIQYETLTQGFRAVGSKTRLDDTYVLAFKVGEKHTLESLNEILSEDDKIKIGYKSKMSLEEAKKRYPDWYQRRIVEGQKKPSEDFVFHRHRGIYDNWKQKIISGAVVGKRYYCLENLCSLAVQCCISPEELEKDCKMIMEHFETLTNDDKNHFTLSDVISALATYYRNDTNAFTRKIEYISERTGIPLQRAKRNGNTRAEHVEIMNFTRQLKGRRDSKYLGGRPDKKAIVQEWRKKKPWGKKTDCQRDTGLSRPTISKYWNVETDE